MDGGFLCKVRISAGCIISIRHLRSKTRYRVFFFCIIKVMAVKHKWTEENIRKALELYKLENGRYPSSREFDLCPYLPAARQIQRRFGGLPAFRALLNLDGVMDFTKGTTRSNIAAKSSLRAYEYEEQFYDFLISKIPEMQVHEQKRIRPGNIDCDYFIYNIKEKSLSVVIDVFFAASLYNLNGVVNIKTKRYVSIPYRTFFVAIGNEFTQEQIDALMLNKKNQLPPHIKVCTEEWFKSNLTLILMH